MPASRHRYRITCQPSGVFGVDRWVSIFVGKPTPLQKGKQKGLWYVATSLSEAESLVQKLLDAAQEACTAGRAQDFLDRWNTCITQQRRSLQSPEWP